MSCKGAVHKDLKPYLHSVIKTGLATARIFPVKAGRNLVVQGSRCSCLVPWRCIHPLVVAVQEKCADKHSASWPTFLRFPPCPGVPQGMRVTDRVVPSRPCARQAPFNHTRMDTTIFQWGLAFPALYMS